MEERNMKRILAMLAACAMIMAVSVVPAMAATVTTSVTISTGGNPPVIKAKWEQDMTANLEDGDPTHLITTQPGIGPNAQFLPPCVFQGKKPYQIFSVVTDPEEGGDVLSASADVFHPDGSFKYQIMQTKLTTAQSLAAFDAAWAAKLVTNNTLFTIPDIRHEIEQGTAKVWVGDAELDYEQQSGNYTVQATAQDHNGNTAPPLTNFFTYVPTNCFDVDFTSVDFGAVTVGTPKKINGNTVWDLPFAPAPTPNGATVRNIGNTNLRVKLNFTDMGFGYSGVAPALTPNVQFDANLGLTGTNVLFDPFVTVTLPDVLNHSSMDKLDLSIHVIKGTGSHTGNITLGSEIAPGWWP
jgi:hypothetical protein